MSPVWSDAGHQTFHIQMHSNSRLEVQFMAISGASTRKRRGITVEILESSDGSDHSDVTLMVGE